MNAEFLVEEICNDKGFLAVYYNPSKPDHFFVGIPLKVTNNFLLLYLLSTDMHWGEVCLCSTKSVYRIEKNSMYLRQLSSTFPEMTNYNFTDPWHECLQYAEVHNLVIRITFFHKEKVLRGIPLQHTENGITIKRINKKGEAGRIYNIDCSKVATLICEGTILQNN